MGHGLKFFGSRRLVLGLGLLLVAAPTVVVWAEDEISGPQLVIPTPPATATSVPATIPETIPATQPLAATAPTRPADEAMLQHMLEPTPGIGAAGTTETAETAAGPIAGVAVVEGVAPKEPAVMRLKEGDKITERLGRLVKDEKTGGFMFEFESDGKTMQDPPMGMIPCKMLEAMEGVSGNGTKPVKFKVSGEVTEYLGKNYLYVQYEQTVRDLNQF